MNSVSVADRHPAFLKDKADALFRQRNFHAALHAYGSAIELLAPDSGEPVYACKCATPAVIGLVLQARQQHVVGPVAGTSCPAASAD